MITKLTKKQELDLKKWHDKCLKIGLSTDPADKSCAEKAIAALYKKIDKPSPRFVWAASPMEAENLINNSIQGKGVKKYNGTSLWGSQDMYWIAFYLFCEQIGVKYKKEDSALLDVWFQIGKSCSWWYPYEKICIISDRPKEIHMNGSTLHKDGGPAVLFRDGYGIYRLNGVEVPPWLAEKKASEISASEVFGLTNAQQRAEAIKKVGIASLRKELKAEVIHTLDNYELLVLEFEGRKVGPYLKMINPSTGQVHIEGTGNTVPGGLNLDIKTCEQALAHKWGDSKYIKPIQLT